MKMKMKMGWTLSDEQMSRWAPTKSKPFRNFENYIFLTKNSNCTQLYILSYHIQIYFLIQLPKKIRRCFAWFNGTYNNIDGKSLFHSQKEGGRKEKRSRKSKEEELTVTVIRELKFIKKLESLAYTMRVWAYMYMYLSLYMDMDMDIHTNWWSFCLVSNKYLGQNIFRIYR